MFGVDNTPALASVIQTTFPNDNLQVAPGQWLIAAEGTAQSLSDVLRITPAPAEGGVGGAMIVAVAGYYGRKPPWMWEWIKTKWGSA